MTVPSNSPGGKDGTFGNGLPPHPTALPLHPDGIPDTLKAMAHWLVWRYVEDVDPETGEVDWDKPPLNARGGSGSSTNSRTWSTFARALAAYQAGGLDGLGFALNVKKGDEKNVLIGVDLDHCRDPKSRAIANWAQAIIDRLDSYTEASPSGEGIRIFVHGRLPLSGRKRGDFECYCTGRYVTVTGQHVEGTPRTIEEREDQLLAVHKQFFPEHHIPRQALAREQRPSDLTDLDIIERAKKASNGSKFAALWSGDRGGYSSPSEADLALCNYLAFWCGPSSSERIDGLFRQSGLFRAKWNREYYRQRTIAKALNGRTDFYTPRRSWQGAPPPRHEGNGAGPGGESPRPQILLSENEYLVNTQAIAALSNAVAAPEVYQRGHALVTVLRCENEPRQTGLLRPSGTPRIAPLSLAQLREILTRIIDFRKLARDRKGESKDTPAHPPAWCVAGVHGRARWPKVRSLEAVSEIPVLRPDGTILDEPGWDAETGLLYWPNAAYPRIPGNPSKAEAEAALDVFYDLVADFPFVNECHRAAWLAALLTALVRFAIAGSCPLFLFDANCPGSGKSMLTDLIAIIATAREMSRTAFPDCDEELRKRITSVALAGDRLLLFDNLDRPLGGAALDAALTGNRWSDRMLGRLEMTPELPMFTVWFATGNNVQIRGDMGRRILPCRLEANVEKPEERTHFRYPHLREHVTKERPRLVSAALTIVRAFCAAGRPDQQLSAFGSFEGWSALVRNCVQWITGHDPCATRGGLEIGDTSRNGLAALIEGWAELPGGQSGLTVAEALRYLKDPTQAANFGTLRDALAGWSDRTELPSPRAIGKRLGRIRGVIVDGRALQCQADRKDTMRWWVKDLRQDAKREPGQDG